MTSAKSSDGDADAFPSSCLPRSKHGGDLRLNQIASSRRLEREAQRNVEMMWQTGRLAPDIKTIAGFGKDNGAATDPDARSMATSGKDTGTVGHNVQAAVDAKHHPIVAYEVINIGNDRNQLSPIAKQAQAAIGAGSDGDR
jgi:hypothetical protein